MANQYSFGRQYQAKLLSMMIRVDGFLTRYRSLIKPAYFEGEAFQDCCRVLLEYEYKFGTKPTLAALAVAIRELALQDQRRARHAGKYDEVLAEIDSATFEEQDDITERIIAFAKRAAIAQALHDCIEDLAQGKLDGCVDRVLAAQRVGEGLFDTGTEFFNDVSWLDFRREEHAHATGIRTLDNFLHGGLAQGELGIVFAPPSCFKTGTLINFAAHAVSMGTTVAFASLELGEAQIAGRFSKRLIGPAYALMQTEDMRTKLNELQKRYDSNLIIKRWPPNTLTPEGLRGWLHKLKDTGKFGLSDKKCMVVVDYAQLLLPQKNSENRHENVRANYQSLLRLADEFSCPVWSAVQATRFGAQKLNGGGPDDKPAKKGADPKYLQVSDISECFAVAADADVIISLNATRDEFAKNELRIHLAKVREAESGRTIRAAVDYDAMRLTDASTYAEVRKRN